MPFLSFFKIKIIYPRGKGPTHELYSSSRRTAVVSLFKNYIQFFGFFSGLGNVASPSSNEHNFLEVFDKAITLFLRRAFLSNLLFKDRIETTRAERVRGGGSPPAGKLLGIVWYA